MGYFFKLAGGNIAVEDMLAVLGRQYRNGTPWDLFSLSVRGSSTLLATPDFHLQSLESRHTLCPFARVSRSYSGFDQNDSTWLNCPACTRMYLTEMF